MKFNLIPLSRIYVDTGPYKSLILSELELLGDSDTVGTSFSVSGETLAIVCSLGSRYKADSLVYYRDQATTENITVFGKQGETLAFDWEELNVIVAANKITVDLASAVGHFSQLKVLHTVTVGSATVYEWEVWTDDGQVLFGDDGSATVFSLDSGTSTLTAEHVQVYNPRSVAADYYCAIDPVAADVAGTTVSLSEEGQFFGLYENGISIPNNFSWASGELLNLTETANTLVLTSGTSGTYYSPILDIDTLEGRRVFWSVTTSGANLIDDVSRDDRLHTVGVRLSSTIPTDAGWASGQLSIDSNWATNSGTLTFGTYSNNHILSSDYKKYIQFKVEFVSPVTGETPILNKIGIEAAQKINVLANSYTNIYVKSTYTDHTQGRETSIIVWSPEYRNDDQ